MAHSKPSRLDSAIASQAASRGYVLETGGIVCEDAAGALLEDPKVRRAYLGVD